MQVVIFDFFGVVFNPHTGKMSDDLVWFLQQLQLAKIKCGIASSSSTQHIKQFLNDNNIEKYFLVIIGADRVQQVKPDPECYIKVAEILHVATTECLIIDDSKVALAAAEVHGFQTIYFSPRLDNFKKIAKIVGL